MIEALDYEAVEALRDAFTRQAQALSSASRCESAHDIAGVTRTAVACETAADALFDAMNVAKSYLDDPDAQAVIDSWLSEGGT